MCTPYGHVTLSQPLISPPPRAQSTSQTNGCLKVLAISVVSLVAKTALSPFPLEGNRLQKVCQYENYPKMGGKSHNIIKKK
jgi:hypothetical protein